MITYESIIIFCWAAFLLVWLVLAFNIKSDIRGGYGNIWRRFWFLRLIIAAFFIFIALHFTNFGLIFSRGILPQSPILDWAAAAFSVIGVSIAIWARAHLGRNWSPRPAAKLNHELVVTGPYAYVRHPIYTGLILMAFGATLTGSVWGICVFIAASLIFILRIGKEEKIMHELFPNKYPEYQKRTKRLVPFVW